MALAAVVGQSQGLDAREVGSKAALDVIAKANRRPVALGIVIAADTFPFTQVISGVKAILGDAPLIGLTTSGQFTSSKIYQRSVVIALLVSNELSVQANWWPDFGADSESVAQKMVSEFKQQFQDSTILVIADGFQGDAQQLCKSLPQGEFSFGGCLSGGDLKQTRTYQVGGQQLGNGGLAVASLKGDITSSVGLDTGWQDVGAFFTVTRTRGPWIQMLDEQPVSDVYARWLGFEPKDWSFPPLNRLVRLYPLGIEQGTGPSLVIRSPLHIENDGSLRMHTHVPVGSVVHLMSGSIESCLSAAQKAAECAKKSLGKAYPVLALVFPDIAWQYLFETRPGAEISAIRKVLGENVPIAGGYVFGQLAKESDSFQFYNQQVQVILLAELSS